VSRIRACLAFCLVVSILAVPRAGAGDLPWSTSVRRDLPLAAAGLGLAAAGHTFAGRIPPVGQTLSSSADVFVLDRGLIFPYSVQWGHVSDAGLVASVAAPLGAYLLTAGFGATDDLAQLGLLELETLSVVTGVMYITKALAQRPRPYAYRSDTPAELLGDPDSRASFFSGHAALAFAAAELERQFVNAADGPRWLAWSGYGLAAVTATGRVLAGVHFPTDVVVGAAVGVLGAKAILTLHERAEKSENVPAFSVGMLSFTVVF